MKRPPDVRFTQDYVLYRPKEQGIFPISEMDWERLKHLVEAIPTVSKVFQNLASGTLGLLGSAILALIGFCTAEGVATWVIPTCWVILASSLVMTAAFLYMDSLQSKTVHASVGQVTAEMKSLESAFVRTMPEEPEPGAPSEAALEIIDEASLAPGDNVLHRTFGLGTVLAVSAPQDGSPIVQVRFKEHGTKVIDPILAGVKKVTSARHSRR